MSGPWIDIRFCTSDDAEALYEIERLSTAAPWPFASFEDDLEGKGEPYVYLCAVTSKGVVCGFVALEIDYPDMWIINLSVLPRYRRHGVGSRLIEAARAVAEGENCRRIRLHVRKANEGAKDFYIMNGFKFYMNELKYYEDGETAEEWINE